MSHIKSNPSRHRRTALKRRQIRRRGYGLLIMVVIILSIVLSIAFIISSMP